MVSDFDLLRLEIDTGWVRNQHGRLVRTREFAATPAPLLVIAQSSDGSTYAIGDPVSDGTAALLSGLIDDAAPRGTDTAVEPSCLRECETLLAEEFPGVEQSCGPGYVVPPTTTFPSPAVLVRSTEAERGRLLAPPEANWLDGEWELLTDGHFGPWAMALIDGHVVSICHSARLSAGGAEAGAWTHPDFRGRGLAAAVTAAWAELVHQTGRVAFYSTSADNASSQKVAQRLNLRLIGWMWQVHARP